MDEKHKPEKDQDSLDSMLSSSFFDIGAEDDQEQPTEPMGVSSAELNGVSSLFEISNLDEDTVNWETMGTFVPVAPKKESGMQKQQPLTQDLQAQSQFAHYTVLERIGAGGMGLVYKAFDNKLEREVALKVLSHVPNAHSKELLRFRQEAKAIAKLNHKNIVQLYEIGESPQNYFAMEYIEGTTLKAISRERKIFPRKAAELIKKIAIAIDEAHKKGIIHRDIKPSNIIIDKNGDAKILDFGIAKLVNRADDISKTGDLLGTLFYMSPEQAQNEPIDFRTDVYSLGATLYELLTGRPPFEGDSHMSVYYQVVNKDVECPRKINPNVSIELSAITLKCMEKNVDKRYRYMSELVADLDNYLNNRPITAKPPTRVSAMAKFIERNRSFCGIAAGVMCIVLAFIAVGYSLNKKLEREQQMHAEKNAKLDQANDKLEAKEKRIAFQNDEFAKNSQQLKQQIQVQNNKIVQLEQRIAKAVKQQKPRILIRKLNTDLENQIRLKNELIKIAKLQKKNSIRNAEFVAKKKKQTKQKEFSSEDEFTAIEETTAKQQDVLAQETTKKNSNNSSNRKKTPSGSVPVPQPNPTPTPAPSPNPNPTPTPKKPSNPLLESGGQLKDTLPTGGKNKFPIKADLSSSLMSADGKRFLLGYNDGSFVVGETTTEKRNTIRHGSPVLSLAMKDTLVITGADDGTVKLWDISKIKEPKPGKVAQLSLTPELTLNEHFDPVKYVAFDPEKNVFYTGSENKPLCTWNAESGELLENDFVMNPILAEQSIRRQQEDFECINFEFDFAKHEMAAVTYTEDKVTIWRSKLSATKMDKEKDIRINSHNVVSSIAICSRTSMIAMGNQDGKIVLLQDGTSKAASIRKHNDEITMISFSQDANAIISASIDDVELWKYNTK